MEKVEKVELGDGNVWFAVEGSHGGEV